MLKVIELIETIDDVYSFRIAIVMYFLKIKKWWLILLIPTEEIVLSLFPLFDWIEEDFVISKTHFPRIGKKYYGPPDRMVGMTGLEFTVLDTYYLEYRKGNERALDCMLACLYRERRERYNVKDHGLDMREDFSPYSVEIIAKNFRKVNP